YGSQSYNNQPALVNDAQSASWEKVTRAVHQSPALIFAQLMHAGALSQYSECTLAPSTLKPVGIKMASFGGEGTFPIPKEMDSTDIERMKQGFIDGAVNAYKAGFDVVEIHGATGYLLD